MSEPIVLVANARMPSQRAQSLQVAQVAASFSRAGAQATLLHARRFPTPDLPPGQDLFDYYAVGALDQKPAVEAVPCIDWIDMVPTFLQYLPARMQELSFARFAAKRVHELGKAGLGAGMPRVLAREAECALPLVRAGHKKVYLEVHRVPGGKSRQRWMLDAAKGCSGVLAISGGVASDLVKLGVDRGKLRVEHDGFEAREGVLDRGDARREIGVDVDADLVVYTGGLLAWKGVEILVDAARKLPGIQFVIAGGMDKDVDRLERHAKGLKNVRFDGFQAPSRVAAYLAAGDLGVVPNRSKPAISALYTSPLKAFEAMAAGLPLVVSDLPSLAEIFEGEPGECGALRVTADDGGALAAGIEQVMADGDLRRSMQAAMQSRAPEHTWDARARRILDWMDEREGVQS